MTTICSAKAAARTTSLGLRDREGERERMSPRVPEWTDREIEEFIAALALLRERLGPSYLLRQLGVSRQAVSDWQRRKSAPSAANMAAVKRLYSVAKKLPD